MPGHTFMLHHPSDMSFDGTYTAPTPRAAALKAASKGVRRILLRKTNTKEIHEYSGVKQALAEPKTVERAGRTVTFAHKPVVKLVRVWVWDSPLNHAQLDALNPSKKK